MTDRDYAAIVAFPAFALGIRCDADEITAIDFLPPTPERPPTTPLAAEAVRQLHAYRADPQATFALPLRPAGTAFQRRVWAAIAAIPSGATQSYGAVAKTIHSGPRAVGGACGANPYPVVVPCHRVVAAAGLGGFGREGSDSGNDLPAGSYSPLAVKRWLLAHEAARR